MKAIARSQGIYRRIDTQDNPGEGNINEDPLFLETGDFDPREKKRPVSLLRPSKPLTGQASTPRGLSARPGRSTIDYTADEAGVVLRSDTLENKRGFTMSTAISSQPKRLERSGTRLLISAIVHLFVNRARFRFLLMGIGLSSVFTFCSVCLADAITVDLHGGAEYTEIQPAIDAAVDGDTVLVKPGKYLITGPLTFRGRSSP